MTLNFTLRICWAGKASSKSLTFSNRLGIFPLYVLLFFHNSNQFPLLVQNFDPENAAEVQRRADWP